MIVSAATPHSVATALRRIAVVEIALGGEREDALGDRGRHRASTVANNAGAISGSMAVDQPLRLLVPHQRMVVRVAREQSVARRCPASAPRATGALV